MKRVNCLLKADDLVGGDRQRTYGHPKDNAARVARHWTAYLKDKLKDGEEITAYEVPFMMILLKIARETGAPGINPDNLVDIAGYARTAQLIDEHDDSQD